MGIESTRDSTQRKGRLRDYGTQPLPTSSPSAGNARIPSRQGRWPHEPSTGSATQPSALGWAYSQIGSHGSGRPDTQKRPDFSHSQHGRPASRRRRPPVWMVANLLLVLAVGLAIAVPQVLRAHADSLTTQSSQAHAGSSCLWHTMKSGETLAKLAREHHTTVATLVKANHISHPNRIAAGRRICIPKSGKQGGGTPGGGTPGGTPGGSVPSYDHVFVILMENHAAGQIIGGTSAPYINSLLSQGAYAANYTAVAHPSLPNYLALTGGSTFGVTTDCNTCFQSGSSIADRLEAAGKTWKAYMESMPSPCFVGDSNPYVQHHDPFVYYDAIRTNKSRCATVVPFTQLSSNLMSIPTTPNYAWISPNVCDDMHSCPVSTGDAWLGRQVPAILKSPAFTQQHSLLVITWDEDDHTSVNHVATILVGASVHAGFQSQTAYTHYSLLKTIEQGLGVQPLTSNDGNAQAMVDMFAATSGTPGGTPGGTASGMPRVAGARMVDGAGRPLVLRGAMLPSSFANIAAWQRGVDPTRTLDAATFGAMATWHMNAARLNISYWIYRLDPTTYLARLDQVVAAAHTAGLYVVLDFHDDAKSGSPYADSLMHAETLTFWTTIAGHYRQDARVLFDPINEPKYTDWGTWLHGNAASGVVGYDRVIAAIRAAGAQQIIVLESGPSGDWSTFSLASAPADPQVIYSVHSYEHVVAGTPASWDAQWGPVLGHAPIYYGEWAVLPNSLIPFQCRGLTSANADATTAAFLAYLTARQASWTAWDFEPSHLITDFTSYEPTTFQTGTPWTCGATTAAQAGMGADVQRFLASHP